MPGEYLTRCGGSEPSLSACTPERAANAELASFRNHAGGSWQLKWQGSGCDQLLILLTEMHYGIDIWGERARGEVGTGIVCANGYVILG